MIKIILFNDLLQLTFHLTKDIQEVEKLFRLAVFNLYTHNRDDHGKNFSFILDNNFHWKLSPAYDLTFSFGPGGEHSTTYMNEGKNPSFKQLEILAQKHSIKNYKTIVEEVRDAISNFEKYAIEYDVSKKVYSNIMKQINGVKDTYK